MKICNKTKNILLCESAIEAQSLYERLLGLLVHKKPIAMVFQTRFGIHTFFMKYPIDVLILDKKKRVAVLKKNLKPNNIFLWNPNYDTVIELPSGTIKKTQTELSDEILL